MENKFIQGENGFVAKTGNRSYIEMHLWPLGGTINFLNPIKNHLTNELQRVYGTTLLNIKNNIKTNHYKYVKTIIICFSEFPL